MKIKGPVQAGPFRCDQRDGPVFSA